MISWNLLEKVMDKIRSHLIIQGRVQGVWFRESTRREASSLGVYGWVKNRPDGTVEVLVEGPVEEVKKLVRWCHHGPSSAVVRSVQEKEGPWTGEFDSFDVTF
jgi:acylphosphatase